MALAHQQMYRHADEDEVYATDMAGVESMGAGSVTSFVRKLFQMVQAECDSIVGFVADGTAFEVKDPRRLEQDILPKYFRHSRFQSLVRQLNFYSFKKISKERSVWIYKHAFFRRDEPELLHALKRKTNQHGAPPRMAVGGGGGEGMMSISSTATSQEGNEDIMERGQRARIPSLSRDVHDATKPRQHQHQHQQQQHGRGHSLPRHPHGSSSISFVHHTVGPPSLNSDHSNASAGGNASSSSRQTRPSHIPTPHKMSNRSYHSSTSRSAGGGPSTGGVGGAAAPSYGGREGPSSRAPGFAWAGAGGHPVTAAGGVATDATGYREGGVESGASRHHDSHRRSGEPTSSLAFRQGPAIGDTSGGGGGSGRDAGGRAVAAGGSMKRGSAAVEADREQALALWGLSALCQVASATEGQGGQGREAEAGDDRTRRLERSHRHFTDVERQHKRPCRDTSAAASRRGWGCAGDESVGNDDISEEEEVEEDGITSAERDDSSTSFHSRRDSNSSCASSISSESSVHRSPPHNPARTTDINACPIDKGVEFQEDSDDDNDNEQQQSRTGTRTSGSSGVFCPTWDWGRAASVPALRLPGSFVDRRYEEVDANRGGDDFMEGGEESSRTEGEDMEEEEETEKERTRTWRNSSATHKNMIAEVSSSVEEESRSIAPTTPPRDLKADMEAEAAVGLEGIGELFNQFCIKDGRGIASSDSVFLATVTNSGDAGLREMAVFCAGPAGEAPDTAPPMSLARQVSSFLRAESAVAQDLRVYAEALDPAAVDVLGRTTQAPGGSSTTGTVVVERSAQDDGKLLRIFCRYAACRLGRAHEVATAAATVCEAVVAPADRQQQHSVVAQRLSPRLDECRWKWWRSAVRFS